jgi:imidazolonepropionase-like amidohydrolase
VGFVRPGYDADIVVWDDHPLANGATPLQVFIDGVDQLDQKKVEKSMKTTFTEPQSPAVAEKPKMRVEIAAQKKEQVCTKAKASETSFIITGIKKTFLDNHPSLQASATSFDGENLALVISNGDVTCLGSEKHCVSAMAAANDESTVRLDLQSGHALPGIIAVSNSLGMIEIVTEPSSGDGYAGANFNSKSPDTITYAKYGVQLRGKAFGRARLGGVTRAISPPLVEGGLTQGVSVGILTKPGKTLLDGGIFQDDVAFHVYLDETSKVTEKTISNSVNALREILKAGKGGANETLYGSVASGKLPLIVTCENQVSSVQAGVACWRMSFIGMFFTFRWC